MKKILLTLFSAIIIGVVFVTPTEVVLADGFVPCSGVDCSFCDLVTMANTVIIWLFGMIAMIFVFLMIVAGVGLVTSGGNQSELESAKSKFTNAIIGVIIVLSAWLLVDTIMRAMITDGEMVGWGPWSEIQCMEQVEPYVDLNTGHSGGTGSVESLAGSKPPQDADAMNQGACTIQGLNEINDAEAKNMESGQTVIWPNSTNIQAAFTAFKAKLSVKGISITANSVYRPQAYQTHLWEIKNRWCDSGLKNNNTPECADLKTGVKKEVVKHFGYSWSCGAVAKIGSTHGMGTGIDIGGIPNHRNSDVMQAAEESCLYWNNYPNDAVHYTLIEGCTIKP